VAKPVRCNVCGAKRSVAVGLSGGAIAGIVIAVVVLLGGGGVSVLFVLKKKKAR